MPPEGGSLHLAGRLLGAIKLTAVPSVVSVGIFFLQIGKKNTKGLCKYKILSSPSSRPRHPELVSGSSRYKLEEDPRQRLSGMTTVFPRLAGC